jgi:four helix bundle protein
MDALDELKVWTRGKTLAINIYKSFSNCRDRGFKDQITRAAISIPSNIAEGYERSSKKEFSHYLKIAKGSCAEVRTQLQIGEAVGLVTHQESIDLQSESLHISKMLQGLINHCNKHIKS